MHLPDAGPENPYQRDLANALEDAGVSTTLIDPDGPGLFAALRAARGNDADVVHLHWLHAFYYGDNLAETAVKSVAFALEVLLLRLLGFSLIWTAHNVVPHDVDWPTYHRVYRRLFVSFAADSVLVHCPRSEDILIETYGLAECHREKFHVVPHGNYIGDYANDISHEEARETLSLDDETTFLFFGNLRPYKGVEGLVDAFERLNAPNTHLIVAGNPASERYGRHLEEVVGNCDDVTLVAEFIPDDDLQTYFNAADAAVFPFRDVLTSGSVVSSLSFGCPPIVPDIGCNDYLVGENAGIVYDPDEPLEDVLTDACNADLVSMREDAMLRAESLNWGPIGERVADIYECVTAR
ncbi:hypothetical protein GCM10009037_01770 [Halarchaeum grantii]|uniref:Glycosyl transferase family 1 domain-containing protein n=1 Tax=Halarchaeum grantii TaxID=1193105 RepID=A0A830EY55_9EURY|nr:hypothetical protein GCM10009037_01770 [Halarchaeum grantii]